jgi:two-component system phosphate regulon response regulator PhoB
MNSTPSGLKQPLFVIEVRIWEIYLLRSRINLNGTLSSFALDRKHHSGKNDEYSKVSFSFLLSDWEKTICALLTKNNIPFEQVSVYKTDIHRAVERKKVYVAEDDLNILFALNTMLEDAGYDVLMSHCGKPMLRHDLPSTDIFILDNRMPDIDGIEICHHLKNQPFTKHIPVIMISALRNLSSEARNAGVDDFLEKPFHMSDLLQLVAKHTSDTSLA